MKIILLENVPSLGKPGDIVQVANGYGRNFLVPRKIALEATPANIRLLEQQKDSLLKKAGREKESAAELAAKIEGLSCVLVRSVGKNDKIFGSVTSLDIHECLTAQGIEIERRKISLAHPIKSVGGFTVPVKLHPDVTAQLKVQVNPAEGEEEKP